MSDHTSIVNLFIGDDYHRSCVVGMGPVALVFHPLAAGALSRHAHAMDGERPLDLDSVAVSPDVARAVRLADWLDDRYIDPVVGLVLPGAGDFAMSLVGLYTVFVAWRHRMPAVVIARMVRNLAIDALVGAIPLLGDAFDFVWRANRKNADLLLQRHVLGPSPLSDWAVVIASLFVLLLAIAVPVVLAVLAFRHL